MEHILRGAEKIIPKPLYAFFQPSYHFVLSLLGALRYGFPSRKIKIIGVTGTKGKSSTVEIINAIFEEAGYTTALTNTIRFKVADTSEENLFKMSMPGRFFMQRLISRAVTAKCDYLIMEITSQGALLFRDRFISLDTLVFTNLSPEHVEAHGSYENYVEEKVGIARRMKTSSKKHRTILINRDEKEGVRFLEAAQHARADALMYGLDDVRPYEVYEEGLQFTFDDKKVRSPLTGEFNLSNIVAAITAAEIHGIPEEIIARAIENFSAIPGRVQRINAGQKFEVVVDYAHTPDSIEKLFKAFAGKRKICVFGSTGGGRDAWKRPVFGKLADEYCEEIILTDDDSYDEDVEKIMREIAGGINNHTPLLVADRRQAIRTALKKAQPEDVVLLVGKGTDPFLMGPNGKKTPWSDEAVAREELKLLLN
jgi:UDP-N-acetylmuramyl-tripeptide synthetase